MISVSGIKEYKERMLKLHGDRIAEQQIDLEFFDDKYTMPLIKDKDYALRPGYVSTLINGITNQLISPIPKVYVKPKLNRDLEPSSSKIASANRLASMFNKWSVRLSRQTVNPYLESFKNKMLSGENYIYICHNQYLATWKKEDHNGKTWQEATPDVTPVDFILYDPMVVYTDPSEEDNGKVRRAMIFYKRTVADLMWSYPNWSKWQGYNMGNEVDFLLYIDGDLTYAEANNEPLFRDKHGDYSSGDGRRRNPFKMVPLTHRYSGLGKDTSTKDPALLAYSRIRPLRDRIVEVSTWRSDASFNMHRFAHRHKTIINQTGRAISNEALKEYVDAPGAISILTLPPGKAKIEVEETPLFENAVFAYMNKIENDLGGEYPATMRGISSGTSGRQEDILSGYGKSIYKSGISGTNAEWSDAYDIACQLFKEIPWLRPPELNENDLSNYSEITVDVEAKDPTELSRQAADVIHRWEIGLIDEETALIGLGKTQEEAQLIMAKKMADRVTRNNEAVAQLMGIAAAREMGTEDELAALEAAIGGEKPRGVGSQGGEPRTGNIKTDLGREFGQEETRPARMSPR